jgi:hypothetical protein
MPELPSPSVLETPELPDARIAFLCAKTGHGKTATSLCRAALFPRVLMVDSKARYTGRGEYPGLVATTGRELEELLREFQGRERWRIAYRGPVLVPVNAGKPDGEKTCEAFFRRVSRIPNFLLVLEEAQNYMTASTMPEGLWKMTLEGRTLGQALTVCSQRPALVARDLTANADQIIAWPGIEPNDQKVLEARGFDPTILASLKGHNSLRLSAPEGGERNFFLCRCDFPHAGTCGEPLPKPPLKFPGTLENKTGKKGGKNDE